MAWVLALCLSSLWVGAFANECTDECDVTYADDGMKVIFCGTDFLSHSSTFGAFDSKCYGVCGVMVYYEGICGCPNDCSASVGQGKCSELNMCTCSEGFGGYDCSIPILGSVCTSHGKLIEGSSVESSFPFDYCVCETGWTGTDCSSEIVISNNTPWGTLFDDAVYSSEDIYGDDHPIWNISTLATVRIELDNDDYIDLLQPWNLYNETYASATMHFDNGVVRETIFDVGFRVKGMTSRMNQKKGWVLHFNEFVSGQKFFDMKKVGFKAGSSSDDTLIKNMLYNDFMRAMGVPLQRASYALLYINNIYAGIYVMQEDLDETFVSRRVEGDSGKGNTYKLFWDVVLQYFGNNVTYYQEQCTMNAMGECMPWYDQSNGDGDWADLVSFLQFLNQSSDQQFLDSLEARVDVPSLLKQMVVESFMLSTDNLAQGANYYMYALQDQGQGQGGTTVAAAGGRQGADLIGSWKDDTQKWKVIEFDFDECFRFDEETHLPEDDELPPNVFDFFTFANMDPGYKEKDPLLCRMLAIDRFNETYKSYYRLFLESVFEAGRRERNPDADLTVSNSDTAGTNQVKSPVDRYKSYLQLILSWVNRDRLWQISFGVSADEFVLDAVRTMANLERRYKDVNSQLE